MNAKAPSKEFLRSVNIFENFPEEALEKILTRAEYVNLDAGKLIFSEGDAADSLYVVVTGEVTITKRMSDKSEKVIAVLGPESVFGEMSLFTPQAKRIASAKAKKFVNYYKIHRDALRELFLSDTEGMAKTFKSLLLTTFERLEKTNRELMTLYELGRLMMCGLTLKQFCQAIVELLCFSIPNVDSGLVYILDKDSGAYSLCGDVASEITAQTIAFDAPIVRSVGNRITAGRAEPAVIDDPAVVLQSLKGVTSAKSLIVLPFEERNQVMGFLLLMNKKKQIAKRDHDGDLALLNTLSVQLSNAVKSMRQSLSD